MPSELMSGRRECRRRAGIALRSAALPRWLAFLGFTLASVLLLGAGVLPWTEAVLPVWVLLLTVPLLIDMRREPGAERGSGR